MITYEMVKRAMVYPPTEDLVDLYNELGAYITSHKSCVQDEKPFEKLNENNFCISATSIQSKYITFILGKKAQINLPEEIVATFFNISSEYKLQFGQITGKDINGCMFLIHQEEKDFNIQLIYNKIYE
jgi:hypothetical protein